MIKFDRTEVDKAIEELNMFEATKKVIEDYENEKKLLEKREEELNNKISELQELHATLLIDRETAKDTPSDYIYLSTQLTKTNEEMNILLSLQDELKNDFKELKMKYTPIIQDTYYKDSQERYNFNVNEAVEKTRYELIKAIADYSNAVKAQERPLMNTIQEFLDDKEVMEANRSFKRRFEFDRLNLNYAESIDHVIHRMDIFSACSGNVKYPKPKEKDVK